MRIVKKLLAWPVILLITGVLIPVVYGGIALNWVRDCVGSVLRIRTHPDEDAPQLH